MEHWLPRVDWPDDLVPPSAVDPVGATGPTPGQARGPRWRRSTPGFYVPAGTDSTRVEQRIIEQATRLPEGGALTGWAALRLAGGGFFDGLAPDGTTRLPVPLAVPPSHRRRTTADFQLLRRCLAAAERDQRHGLPCVTPVRAVLDEVHRIGELREAVVVLDMALVARLATFEELDAFIASHTGLPGVSLMRRARGLASDRSRSPMETRMRLIWVLDAGLPTPRCNWPIADANGRWLGSPDLLCDELAVFGEFDGADHRERGQHRTDVERDDLFRRTGLEGFGLVGADIHDRPRAVARMLAAAERARESNRPRTWLVKMNPRPLWP